jgi:hypothetical protein
MDDASREALAAHADYSICAGKVIQVLQQLELERGLPLSIRTDNGPRGGRRSSSARNWPNGAKKSKLSKNLFSQESQCKTGTTKG